MPRDCPFCPDFDHFGTACPEHRPDPLTPRFVFDVGMGSGMIGEPLSKCVADMQEAYGPLSRDQLEDMIQGWQDGSRDADAYRLDMQTLPFPVVPGGEEPPF